MLTRRINCLPCILFTHLYVRDDFVTHLFVLIFGHLQLRLFCLTQMNISPRLISLPFLNTDMILAVNLTHWSFVDSRFSMCA